MKVRHGDEHCVTVINRSGEVKSRACSSDLEDARAKIGISGKERQRAVLMTIYDHPDFGIGGDIDEILGDSGPCDAEGYGIEDLGSWVPGEDWNNRISSFISGSSCDIVRGYDKKFYEERIGEWFGGSTSGATVPDMGDANDRLESVFLRNNG